MEDFTLNKLWDLRAQLDNAVINKKYEEIEKIKNAYVSLVDRAWHYSRAFICYNHAFWTIGERQIHNSQNVISILKNIENYEKKYVMGEDVSLKLKNSNSTRFLAGEIWALRAMYDKFLLQNKKKISELSVQQNMILGKAIIDRLVTLIHMEQTEAYYDQLRPILQEVREGYEGIYGKQQPKIDYSQIVEDFLEK